ncbi:hypothetical protein AALO_G00063070 [Alosa alosa]|uniref:Uncharacterized protein n=1 Tax=Alosa alosa TaxID=278164 RepID=A0AAV6H011_9TELE|nr:hypothetical protein AALO_G00063070 [Alosa alosa]
MSLPVNSDLFSLEKIARYRHACSNGSPYAINKPIDIKPRKRCEAQAWVNNYSTHRYECEVHRCQIYARQRRYYDRYLIRHPSDQIHMLTGKETDAGG